MKNQNGFVKTLIVLAIVVFVGYYVIHDMNIFGFPVRRGVAGIPAPTVKPATGQVSLGEIDGFSLTAEYKYSCDIRGLVVNERHYGGNSVIDKAEPVSVILAWGAVAENNDKIDFKWEQPIRGVMAWDKGDVGYEKIGGDEVFEQCCTDAYLIPADDSIRESFRKIRQGDQLHITGYLVDVNGKKADGYSLYWGTGDLAKCLKGEAGDSDMCTVIYVTKLQWVK